MDALKFLKIAYNHRMKKVSFSLIPILLCLFHGGASAANLPAPVAAAIELWKMVTPDQNRDIFDGLTLNPVTGDHAPLARYRPEQGGIVDIGQNIRDYKRDYIFLSSSIDMSTKPDFDQYLAVMIMLSLSNEATHILQDKNGSLKDFYQFYQSGDVVKACGLYALQQHVSDIMMLKTALRAENLFLGVGSTKGINALRISLEKNNLRDEFEDFRDAMQKKNISYLNTVLSGIRSKRNEMNLSGLKFCPPSGNIELDQQIVNRATEPVGYPFTTNNRGSSNHPLTYNP